MHDDSDDFFDVESSDSDVVRRRPIERRLDEDARAAKYESDRRGLWAIAAIAALAYVALLSALVVFFHDAFNSLNYPMRCIVFIATLAVTYGLAYGARRVDQQPTTKLLGLFGILVFGLSLALLSKTMPTESTDKGYLVALFSVAFPSIAPFWAFGAFTLAYAYHSRAFHYCAALAILFWLVTDSGSVAAYAALACCALGEYWGWNRKSASVAALYAALAVWALMTEKALWTRESLVLVAVAASVLLFWFGAVFKITPLRGAALVVAACALGVASFPFYWSHTISADHVERYGQVAVYGPSIFCAVMFVLYCVNLTLGGAQHCMARFLLGVVASACWIVGHAVSASKNFGPTGAAAVLIVVAIFLVGLLLLERRFRAVSPYFGPDGKLVVAQGRSTTTLDDDKEFDDPIESERRARQNAAPVLALSEAYESFKKYGAKNLRKPFVAAAVALQFGLLVLNAVAQIR